MMNLDYLKITFIFLLSAAFPTHGLDIKGAVIDNGNFKFILSSFSTAYSEVDGECQDWGSYVLQLNSDAEYDSIQSKLSEKRFTELNRIWLKAVKSFGSISSQKGVPYKWGYSTTLIAAKNFDKGEPDLNNAICKTGEGTCLAMVRKTDTAEHHYKLVDTCCEDEHFFLCRYLDDGGSPATPTISGTNTLQCSSSEQVLKFIWERNGAVVLASSNASTIVVDGNYFLSGQYTCRTISMNEIVSLRSNPITVDSWNHITRPEVETSEENMENSISGSMSLIHSTPLWSNLRPSFWPSTIDSMISKMTNRESISVFESHQSESSSFTQTKPISSIPLTGFATIAAQTVSLTETSSTVDVISTAFYPPMLTLSFNISVDMVLLTFTCKASYRNFDWYIFTKDGKFMQLSFSEVVNKELTLHNAVGSYRCTFGTLVDNEFTWPMSNAVTFPPTGGMNPSPVTTGTGSSFTNPSFDASSRHNLPSPSMSSSFPINLNVDSTSPMVIGETRIPSTTPAFVEWLTTITTTTTVSMTLSFETPEPTSERPSPTYRTTTEITDHSTYSPFFPRPEMTPLYSVVYSGYSVRLLCLTEYLNIAEYVFVKMDALNGTNGPTTVVYRGPSSFLIIQNVEPADEGNYSCMFVTTDNRQSSYSMTSLLFVVPDGALCYCPSQASTLSTLDDESVDVLISDIHRSLTIPVKDLSATIRKKTSATDERPSSTAIGCVAIVILVFVTCLLVMTDAINVFWLNFQGKA